MPIPIQRIRELRRIPNGMVLEDPGEFIHKVREVIGGMVDLVRLG
jgi:hypothetical protein